MSTIRILVADDDRLFRRLIAYHLTHAGKFQVVGEAENGRDAVEQALQLRPDVILMDLNMPHLSGIEAMERILARHPHIKVVVLTDLGPLASLGTFSGAAECLKKDSTPEEVVAAVRRVYAQEAPAPGVPETAAPGGGDRIAIEHLAMRHGLTPREKLVFTRSVSAELTTRELAQAIAGELGKPFTESAVKHTVDRIMTKMRVEPRTHAALLRRVRDARPGR